MKVKKLQKQELQQATAWLKAFKYNQTSSVKRMCSFLPDLAHNEHMSKVGLEMMYGMLTPDKNTDPLHLDLFDALMKAMVKNPTHIHRYISFLSAPGTAYLVNARPTSVTEALLSVLNAKEESLKKHQPSVFELIMENNERREIARQLGYSPEHEIHIKRGSDYNDWMVTKNTTTNMLSMTHWLMNGYLDIEPEKLQSPKQFYRRVLANTTSAERKILWDQAQKHPLGPYAYICGRIDSNAKNSQRFHISEVLDHVSQSSPTPLLWGFMLRSIDAKLTGLYTDGLDEYEPLQKAWPLEFNWLVTQRNIQHCLDETEVPFHLRSIWDATVYQDEGCKVQNLWAAQKMHTDTFELPCDLNEPTF